MPLTRDNIYQLIQSNDLRLVFDTSVTVRGGFLDICDQVQRINSKRQVIGVRYRIKLSIPAVAHTERLFDLAQMRGAEYDIEKIRTILARYQLEILDFTQMEAEHCAELLIQKYKTPTDWRAFKKRRCLECVGLPHDYQLATGKGNRCGAPNDWLIISQARHDEAMILVMDDKGKHQEFSLVPNIAYSLDIEAVVKHILLELTPQN